MKATLALVVDHQTQNSVFKLAWHLHTTYHMNLDTCRLPPHISLKQPFVIDTVDTLEQYAHRLVSHIPLDDIACSHIEAFTPEGTSDTLLVWFSVVEPPWLRRLHMRLNADMRDLFTSTQAPFDGDAYHFHLTIAMSPVDAATRTTIVARYHHQPLALVVRPVGLALFVYNDTTVPATDYMTYAIVPLTG